VGVLTQSDKSESIGCDVTVGPLQQELGGSLGSSCHACCYGGQASEWKKLEEVAPALCGSFLSEVSLGKNGDRDSNRTWLT
jgi:hypothetical protein